MRDARRLVIWSNMYDKIESKKLKKTWEEMKIKRPTKFILSHDFRCSSLGRLLFFMCFSFSELIIASNDIFIIFIFSFICLFPLYFSISFRYALSNFELCGSDDWLQNYEFSSTTFQFFVSAQKVTKKKEWKGKRQKNVYQTNRQTFPWTEQSKYASECKVNYATTTTKKYNRKI